ncbi:MAG: hypothetical protein JW722_03315 [Demequinaceae bacterium]|nr:hypothetical protein [Demequinaceae bacterium]
MSERGAFSAVVSEVAGGTTAAAAARRMGIPVGLADTIVEEAERLGLLSRYGGACASCDPSAAGGCVGCPMTRIRRGA